MPGLGLREFQRQRIQGSSASRSALGRRLNTWPRCATHSRHEPRCGPCRSMNRTSRSRSRSQLAPRNSASGSGFKFRVRVEKRVVATDAAEHTFVMHVEERTADGRLFPRCALLHIDRGVSCLCHSSSVFKTCGWEISPSFFPASENCTIFHGLRGARVDRFACTGSFVQ